MKYYDETGTLQYSGTLQENKLEAFTQVSINMDDIAQTNVFMTSLGFPADNRWQIKNDIFNAICAIDAWYDGQALAYFRDANNLTHGITLDQMKLIKKEAQQNLLIQYSNKWRREFFIENVAQTPEEVWYYVEVNKEWIETHDPVVMFNLQG